MGLKADVVVIDLDGTLCNTRHRDHFAQAGEWEQFHSAAPLDTPHWDVVHLLRMIPEDDIVLVITGRNEKWRKVTDEWLKRYDLRQYIDEILMRPDDDFTKAAELKLRLLIEWLHMNTPFEEERTALTDRVKFALDDREKVIDAFRDFGIACWQTRAGAY